MSKSGEKNSTKYTITYSSSFAKSIKKIEQKDLTAIRAEIESLTTDPYSKLDKIKNPNIKGKYKTMQGDYRVLLDIVGTEIQIHTVKHRKEVYKIK